MRSVLSTRIFAAERLTASRLDRVSRAGFEAAQIFADRRCFDYRNPSQIDELRNWFADSTLELDSLRAPAHSDLSGGRGGPETRIRITNRDKAERIRSTDELKRVLEVADRMPFARLILPFGAEEEDYDPHQIDAAFNALDELLVFSRGLDVEILLANQPSEMGSASKLELFLSMTHLPFGYAFDVSAAARSSAAEQRPVDQFETMREKTRSIIAADATEDAERVLPFVNEGGAVDWDSLRDQIGEHPRKPDLVLDAEPGDAEQPLDAARESFDRLEEHLYG